MIVSLKSTVAWLAITTRNYGGVHGQMKTSLQPSQLNSRALRKDGLQYYNRPTYKPTHGKKSVEELLMQKITKRPSHRPSIPIEPQPLGQSMMSFKDVHNEYDRHDELLFVTVTRAPTKLPTNVRDALLMFEIYCLIDAEVVLILIIHFQIFLVTNKFTYTFPNTRTFTGEFCILFSQV